MYNHIAKITHCWHISKVRFLSFKDLPQNPSYNLTRPSLGNIGNYYQKFWGCKPPNGFFMWNVAFSLSALSCLWLSLTETKHNSAWPVISSDTPTTAASETADIRKRILLALSEISSVLHECSVFSSFFVVLARVYTGDEWRYSRCSKSAASNLAVDSRCPLTLITSPMRPHTQ